MLIRVFAGRTCHFVGFVMRRLISESFILRNNPVRLARIFMNLSSKWVSFENCKFKILLPQNHFLTYVCAKFGCVWCVWSKLLLWEVKSQKGQPFLIAPDLTKVQCYEPNHTGETVLFR